MRMRNALRDFIVCASLIDVFSHVLLYFTPALSFVSFVSRGSVR